MRNTLAWLIIGLVAMLLLSCTQTKPASATDDTSSASSSSENPESSGDSSISQPSEDFWKPPEGRKPRFLFVHHSTGEGFLFDGGMKDMLEKDGFEVHNRTYGDGWVGDNTNPADFPVTFTEHFDDLISWDLPEGEHYDIIAFKSCFPASNICSDEDLEAYKGYYETIKTVTRQHPEILFIPWSTPPLVPNGTEPECAARARDFATWLTGPYIEGESNLASFDVFSRLAGDDPSARDYNCLKYDYQADPNDSHPNHMANMGVANDFFVWLSQLVWRRLY